MPKLSVSNLAWSEANNGLVLPHLQRLGVRGVEVAPTRIAPWGELTEAKVRAYRAAVESAGLQVSSLQAIYFGIPEARLLSDHASFKVMFEHMQRVAEIGALLGAEIMVYGAPGTRKLAGQTLDALRPVAIERFNALGDIAKSYGIRIGIEPVPETYGSDYLTTGAEVIDFVREVGHPFVHLHLDTGCALLGGYSIENAILDGSALLSHFHAAEPNLNDFSKPQAHHRAASRALRQCRYERWIAIEMRELNSHPIQALSTAVEYAIETYAIAYTSRKPMDAAQET